MMPVLSVKVLKVWNLTHRFRTQKLAAKTICLIRLIHLIHLIRLIRYPQMILLTAHSPMVFLTGFALMKL